MYVEVKHLCAVTLQEECEEAQGFSRYDTKRRTSNRPIWSQDLHVVRASYRTRKSSGTATPGMQFLERATLRLDQSSYGEGTFK